MREITRDACRLGQLYITKARLKTTEKLSVLLSTVAFVAIIAAIVVVLAVFITLGVGHILATTIAPHLAYLIVAGFYLILLVAAIILRKSVIINPIARFMSRLILDAPDDKDLSNTTHRESNSGNASKEPEIDYDKLARHVVSVLESRGEPVIAITAEEGGES